MNYRKFKDLFFIVLIFTLIFIIIFVNSSKAGYFDVFQQEILLKQPHCLIYKPEMMYIEARTGYDHVVNFFVRSTEMQNIIGVKYYFENETCSDRVVINYIFKNPQDWSRYDGMEIYIYGDGSNNTLQFWFFDSVMNKWIGIGSVTLNWDGWKKFKFYINPLYKRHSVTVFRIQVLHEKFSEENKVYELYISNPIFIDNLIGKLNITFSGWTKYDRIYVTAIGDTPKIKINYNFTSFLSKQVVVDRNFILRKNLSEMNIMEISVYGDGSNNILKFWYHDYVTNRWYSIGSTIIDWKGWSKKSFTLKPYPRTSVDIIRISIINNNEIKLDNENEVPIYKPIAINNSGTIYVKSIVFRQSPFLDIYSKLLIFFLYFAVSIPLMIIRKIAIYNTFLMGILCIIVGNFITMLNFAILANDILFIGYVFLTIGLGIIVIGRKYFMNP